MRLPNGYGGIIKLGGNRRKPWAVRLTVGFADNGQQKYKYLGYYEKRTEALAAIVEYNKNPYDIDTHNITFAEVFDAWSARKFDKVSKHSVRNYKSIYRKCSALYSMPFINIKTSHLQAVIDEHKALANVNLLKVLFGQLYGYAREHDICEKDYSEYVELPNAKDKKKKTPFSAEEVKVLWDNIDKPHVDLVLILLYTGMRITELLEMEIKNVHLSDRYMVGGIKTKAGKNRIIPIHRKIEPLIRKQIADDKTYLFQSSRGNMIAYNYFAAKKFAPLMHALGMAHTLHETRHSFISQCDRLSLNTTAVKRIVGHANGDVTDIYTHKDAEELIEIIDAFEY